MTLDKSKVKPFPWRCPRCLKKAVQMATIPYAAQRIHEGSVQTIHISELSVPQCAECKETLFTESVNEQIENAFLAQQKIGAEVS